MANKHFKRWLLKMPLGFLLIAAGITAIIYPVYSNRPREEWMIWGAASIVTFIVGLLFLGSALVHKVKSDLIRRGRPMYKVIEEKEEEEED